MTVPQKLRNSLRISVRDLRPGMFIDQLDRPWSETPFLIQGFLLTDPAHLATLRNVVAEVVIDPMRSSSESLLHLPWESLHESPADVAVQRKPASPAPAVATFLPTVPERLSLLARIRRLLGGVPGNDASSQPEQYYLRYADQPASERVHRTLAINADRSSGAKAAHAVTVTPPSTKQFSAFIVSLYPTDNGIGAIFNGLMARLRGSAKASLGKPPKLLSPRERPDFLPANMPLVVYHDQATLAEETVRAKAAFEQAGLVLEKLVTDLQADLPVSIEEVKPIVDALVDSVVSNPAALMWSARMRDESKKTYLHGLRVAIYMMTLGRHIGFPKEQLSELGSIGLLLDIGMLKMPPGLLEKAGELTAAESALLIKHVAFSIEALQQSAPLPRFVARGILEHHERIDGSGYPQGLAGTDISVYGRMAAIADTFAAMTTARAYDVTHSAFDAMKELFRDAETKLHAPLVEQFVQAISIFPVGSLIELTSGEAAIVLEHNGVRRLEPKILVLTDSEKELLAHPYTLDLMNLQRDRKTILRGLADGSYGIDYNDYYLN
jgi:HD-GYP domain-containing protein (c-di-GMP phosphodiesterase class II)